MNITSAEANKMLRKLADEHALLLRKETSSASFYASVGEDPEDVRPEYDYALTQKLLAENESKTRKLKHALNVFNTTTVVPGFDMTIDEMLVYIPQLTKAKEKLGQMMVALPKARREENFHSMSNIVDYVYANYDIAATEADFEKVSDMLSKAQTAIDRLNNAETFAFEF